MLLPPPITLSVLSGILQVIKCFFGGTIANSWPLIQPEKAVKCAENTQNHQKWTESGPYGSVWADTCAESIPRALGSLWDASRPLKRPQKSKNPGFGGLGVRGEASPLFPLFALKGCGQKFNNPMQRLSPAALLLYYQAL